jgi:hypothetical protein
VKGLIATGSTWETCGALRAAVGFLLSKQLPCGRGLHSSTSQLNLSRLTQDNTLHTLHTPLTRATQPLRAPPTH